jgi:hypothetical protein
METAAAVIGIAGIVGVVDVIIKAFEHVQSVVEASGVLATQVRKVLDICKQVEQQLKKRAPGSLPDSISEIRSTLDLVSEIATKYKNNVTRFERIKHMPKALGRLNKLGVIEGQMKTVLLLVTAHVTEETNANVKDLGGELGNLRSQLLSHNAELTDLSLSITAEFEGIHAGLTVMQQGLAEVLAKVDDVAAVVLRPEFLRNGHSVSNFSECGSPDDAKELLAETQKSVQDLLTALKVALADEVSAAGPTVVNSIYVSGGSKFSKNKFNQATDDGREGGRGQAVKTSNTISVNGSTFTENLFSQGGTFRYNK